MGGLACISRGIRSGITRPGQSTRRMSGVQKRVWKCFVLGRRMGKMVSTKPTTEGEADTYFSWSFRCPDFDRTEQRIQQR